MSSPGVGVRYPARLLPPRLLTRFFVLAALANLAQSIAGFLFVHLPGFLVELGAGEREVGRIGAVFSLAGLLLAPWIGRFIDLRGRVHVILAGYTLNLVATSLYFTIDALDWRIYAIRLLHGMGGTALYTSLFTYGADCVPVERRTEGLALFGACGLLPMALSALLGDWILQVSSYRGLFLSSLGFELVGLLLCTRLREQPAAHTSAEPSRGFAAVLAQPSLGPVWLASLVFFMALACIFTFLKTYVIASGHGSVGGFFSAYASVAVILRVFFGWLPDRVGAERILGPSLLCYAAGLTLLAGAGSAAHVAAAGLLCGVGHAYTYPILFALVIGRARAAERGAGMAVYTAIDAGAGVVAGPLLGSSIEARGYALTLGAVAVAVVSAALAFVLWERGRRASRACP